MESLMRQEIFSEPTKLLNTIANCKKVIPEIVKAVKEKNITNFAAMARGTSDNAVTVFNYLMSIEAKQLVSTLYPSVYTVYNSTLNLKGTMLFIVSQSGMSKDTIKVMHDAMRDGAIVVGVTNNINSPVAKEAHFHIFLDVDEERSVAATKTYIAELFALEMVSKALAGEDLDCFDKIIKKIELVLGLCDTQINAVAKGIIDKNDFLILSRGTMAGTGDELCLKMTECCYLYAKAFSSATFMHGPLSLLAKDANVILLAPESEFTQEFIDMAKRVKEKGANLIAFSDIKEVLDLADFKVEMPKACKTCGPIIYGVAASLLALNIGTEKGYNVDAPRNLNKVTVTL